MANNNWELCPKCNGMEGMPCHICNNTGLISRYTGLPPLRTKKPDPIAPVTHKTTISWNDILRKYEETIKEKQDEWDRINIQTLKPFKLDGLNPDLAETLIGIENKFSKNKEYQETCAKIIEKSRRGQNLRDYTNQVETTKTEL